MGKISRSADCESHVRLFRGESRDLSLTHIHLGFCSALDSLFDTLKKHGSTFRTDFWDSVCQEVLFPIFAPLRSGPMQEEMSFWVSTTMVSALRNLVDLYTFYFEILERFLDPLLDLLCFCIDQGQSIASFLLSR